jgi:hypothetical protein
MSEAMGSKCDAKAIFAELQNSCLDECRCAGLSSGANPEVLALLVTEEFWPDRMYVTIDMWRERSWQIKAIGLSRLNQLRWKLNAVAARSGNKFVTDAEAGDGP